jgi:hypothetical protein
LEILLALFRRLFLILGAFIDLFVIAPNNPTMSDFTGVALFVFFISLYPAIFGVTKIVYFFRYHQQEKSYRHRFLEAVKQSKNYEDFIDLFYHGKITFRS